MTNTFACSPVSTSYLCNAMSDLHKHRHRSGSHRSREGSHSSHSNGGGALARPRRNYKLISDPSIDLSSSEKQYRFEGVLTGHSPIEDPIDPRAIGGRFVLGAREFPVPRFVYDEFSIGDPPQRDVFISGINDNLREDDLTKLCQKMGEVHSVQVYYHPERKAHLGGATVSFLKSTSAMKALKELNGKKMMGQCLQVSFLTQNAYYLSVNMCNISSPVYTYVCMYMVLLLCSNKLVK